MNHTSQLALATLLGVAMSLCAQGIGETARPACGASSDLSRLNKRFDDLEKAIVALQTQSAQSANGATLANADLKRQLSSLGSQIADVNTAVVSLSGRVR